MMTDALRNLAPHCLRAVADALDARRLQPPYTELTLRRFVSGEEAAVLAADLLQIEGIRQDHLSWALRLLAKEREAAQRVGERVELVWTGPDVTGSASRDTGVVVRELFGSAKRSVLVAGYAVWDGRHVFRRLAEKMDEDPALDVRMFLNIGRPEPGRSNSEIVRAFAERFVRNDWSGSRRPSVYYDPRALLTDREQQAVLHVKCVLVDDERSFLGSANFTEAAQERNLEAGVLIEDSHFTVALRNQFEALIGDGKLLRVSGL